MKFKIFTESKEEVKNALEEFKKDYMKEFEKQDGKSVMGFRINITPVPPLTFDQPDGVLLIIPIPFPSWAMRLINKDSWIRFISDFLKARNIKFKEIKYTGE